MFVFNKLHRFEIKFQSLPGLMLAMIFVSLAMIIYPSAGVSANSVKSLLQKGDQYFDKLDYKKAEEYYRNALVLIKNEDSWIDEASVKNKLTIVLWKIDELDEASALGHESLQFCLDHFGWNNTLTVDALINLGIISLLNQNTLSLMYLEKANMVARRLFGEKNPKSATALQWMGMTYDSYADSVNTRKYLFGSLKIWLQLYGSDDYHLADIYRFIGLFHNRWERLDSSNLFQNRAIMINDRKYGINNIISANCINNIANSYLNSGNYDTIMYLSNLALKRLDQTPVYQRKIRSNALFNMADASEKAGNLPAALDYVVKALTLFYPELSGLGNLANPDVQSIKNYSYSQLFFEFKRKVLYEFLNDKNTPYEVNDILLSINQLIAIETALQDQVRSQLLTLEDFVSYEILQSKKMWDVTQNKLDCSVIPGDTSNYSEVINLFVGSQLSIGFGINMNFADNTQNLLSSIAEQRHVLSEKIVDLQRKLNARQTEPAQAMIKEELLENKIVLGLLDYKTGLKQKKFNSLHQKPQYYFSQIKKALKPTQILFMFTQTAPTPKEPEWLYQMVITKDVFFGITRFDCSTVLNDVAIFNRLMAAGNHQKQLDSVGYRIYHALFEPFQKYLKDKEVIILPAGKLETVPMDILMTDPELQRRFMENNLVWNIMSLDVIIKKNKIPSYEGSGSILAVAPSFSKERSKEIALLTRRDERLIDLPFARKECEQISQIFKTTLFEGNTADESLFKNLAGKFPILHISTHGVSDNGVCPTKLAFSKKENHEDGFLDFFEILDLKLNNELTVLSSCKSGLTETEVPVGSLNLGWAFAKAGSESVVVSLWDANDYTSSVIIPAFYRNLKEGMTRPEALRQAKITFLQSADNVMKHPYYWAGFQYYGPNETVMIDSVERINGVKYGLTAVVVLLILASIYFWFAKRHS